MKKASFVLVLLLVVTVALPPLAAAPPPLKLELGAPLPDAVANSTAEIMRCLTAEAHFDPCSFFTMGNVRYVVAWDQASYRLVYLFTTDAGFRTQSNLAVGGRMRVTRSRLLSFKNWQIDPRSASAGWLPVVEPLDEPSIVGEQDETTALVIGFVRTVYLNERILTR